ncbi:MAG TPA: nickel-binding protein [Nitrososphaerales archaeon]|nr:nickel-binding protein [Nitrososphaerales archaeon]
MPIYLDVHSIAGRNEERLKKVQDSPRDEFGVVHLNLFYNIAEDRWFCLHDAPNKEAVEKHHEGAGLKCDWVVEVKATKAP